MNAQVILPRIMHVGKGAAMQAAQVMRNSRCFSSTDHH